MHTAQRFPESTEKVMAEYYRSHLTLNGTGPDVVFMDSPQLAEIFYKNKKSIYGDYRWKSEESKASSQPALAAEF